ncbi:hypothetical protein U9M48_025187 [Paspalum notatum var. saurae]|uniref:F-box domain-containing protein n=1 Tax=Paspalum notatum var. saurae TaxID=547442 RepID=A0AAQ3TS27_PASNO
MAPPRPPLPEEFVEEILVRFPPDDPASLVRAALVCKLWRRLILSPAFCRTYSELHRAAAPVLGVLCQAELDPDDCRSMAMAQFVPATSFYRPAVAVHYGCRVIDARHGRVLLQRVPPWPPSNFTSSIDLFVWDPVRNERRHLPGLPWHIDPYPCDWRAAVMCAAGGRRCRRDHHLDCAPSSFLVVLVMLDEDKMFSRTYASEAGAWTETQVASTKYHSRLKGYYVLGSGVLVADALHFMVHQPLNEHILSIGVLRYDLLAAPAAPQLSAIRLPLSRAAHGDEHLLVPMEDGRLGLASMDKAKLCLYWPTDKDAEQPPAADSDRFVLGRVIYLEKLLSVESYLTDFNFADAIGVLFIRTSDGGLSAVDIKSGHVRRLPGCYMDCDHVVPILA